MIKGGYYLKARQIQNSWIATQPPHVREIWDWLIKEANHKDKKYSGFIVKRGQLFRTYKEIREGLHWMVGYRKMMYHENQTKRAMKALREHLMISTTKKLGGVLITINNYDTYQDPRSYESTNGEPTKDTMREPMMNHTLPYNNKNEKNEKKERINKKQCESVFEEFRKIYPGKVRGLNTEFRDFTKKHKDWENILPLLKPAIENQIKHSKILKGKNLFVPNWKNLKTWLNQRSWEEEIPEESKGRVIVA